jgi:uncharacterized protein with ParB-like and HNH nuclease domain
MYKNKKEITQTLSNIFMSKVFQVPNYQRGYNWGVKQLNTFVQDIDKLTKENIISHYTGEVIIYKPHTRQIENYGTEQIEVVEIVDGQQRLTTCNLYLSIIIKELNKIGNIDFNTEISNYLYSGSKSKLRLNNNTSDFYLDLISNGERNVKANSVHQNRIFDAYCFLKNHIYAQLEIRADQGIDYLKDLFNAIISKLHFSLNEIDGLKLF